MDENKDDKVGFFDKKRKKTPKQYKQRLGILFKITLLISILMIILSASTVLFFADNQEYAKLSQSMIALTLILIMITGISYFFKYQFDKLEKIVEDIESNPEYIEEEQ